MEINSGEGLRVADCDHAVFGGRGALSALPVDGNVILNVVFD